MIKLRHSGIVVRNLEKTLDFYTHLGFKVVKDVVESGKFIDTIVGFNEVIECKGLKK